MIRKFGSSFNWQNDKVSYSLLKETFLKTMNKVLLFLLKGQFSLFWALDFFFFSLPLTVALTPFRPALACGLGLGGMGVECFVSGIYFIFPRQAIVDVLPRFIFYGHYQRRTTRAGGCPFAVLLRGGRLGPSHLVSCHHHRWAARAGGCPSPAPPGGWQ